MKNYMIKNLESGEVFPYTGPWTLGLRRFIVDIDGIIWEALGDEYWDDEQKLHVVSKFNVSTIFELQR